MSEKFYKKKNGKNVPVNDPYALAGLTNGTWLVSINGGNTRMRTLLNPKHAELDAALDTLSEELTRELMKQSKMRPLSIKISEKERKAGDAFEKVMGKDVPTYVGFSSMHDIACNSCDKIKKIIIENKFDVKKIKEKYNGRKLKVENAISTLELDE